MTMRAVVLLAIHALICSARGIAPAHVEPGAAASHVASSAERTVEQGVPDDSPRRALQETSEELGWWDQTTQTMGGLISAPIGDAMRSYINPAFEWVAANWVQPCANIAYTAFMIYLFVKLPRHVALVIGLATFLIGPTVAEIIIELAWLIVQAAAKRPISVVFGVWFLMFFTTKFVRTWLRKTWQKCAMCLGMDVDQDGDVDWLDVLYFFQHRTACGRWLNENVLSHFFDGDDAHAYFSLQRKQAAPSVQAQAARLQRIEEMLEKLTEQLADKKLST